MNTSATGGYLQPTSTGPAQDAELEDQIQAAIVGITGLAGSLVRPRWQQNPPKQPAINVNWCAFGITRQRSDNFNAVRHISAGDGSDQSITHETIELLVSFYGPAGQANAAAFKDGLQIPQNMEVLQSQGMAFYEARDTIAAPELISAQWMRRFDVPFTLRRQITRTYPVLNLLGAGGSIQSETNSENWTAQER